MAMTKAGLKAKILSELATQGFVTTGTHAWAQKFAEAVANAVVTEIQTNAEISTSGSHAPTGSGDHVHGPGKIQ